MTRRIVKIILLALIFLGLISYSIFIFRGYLRGPVLEIYSPKDGESLSSNRIIVSGYAPYAHEIKLNDNPVLINEQGQFGVIRVPENGYNIYTIVMEDVFGRKIEKTIRFYNNRP